MITMRPYDDARDFGAMYDISADPDAMRYIRVPVTDEGPVRERMDIMLAYREKHPGHGIFMLENAETGELVGNVVFRHANWDGSREVEIGYVIIPKFWRLGYATAAVQMLKDYAVQQHQCNYLVAFTDAANTGSNRVLEKSGFSCIGEERIYDADCLKWETLL